MEEGGGVEMGLYLQSCVCAEHDIVLLYILVQDSLLGQLLLPPGVDARRKLVKGHTPSQSMEGLRLRCCTSLMSTGRTAASAWVSTVSGLSMMDPWGSPIMFERLVR